MAETYDRTPRYLHSPACSAFAVTKADADFGGEVVTRGLYVGGAGDVVVRLKDDSADVTFSAVPAGTVLPIRAKRVAAATTATNIVGLV